MPTGLSGTAGHILDDGRIVGDLRDSDLWADSDSADAWLWDGNAKPSKLGEHFDLVNADGDKYRRDVRLAAAESRGRVGAHHAQSTRRGRKPDRHEAIRV